jgi:hypothetical protein
VVQGHRFYQQVRGSSLHRKIIMWLTLSPILLTSSSLLFQEPAWYSSSTDIWRACCQYRESAAHWHQPSTWLASGDCPGAWPHEISSRIFLISK